MQYAEYLITMEMKTNCDFNSEKMTNITLGSTLKSFLVSESLSIFFFYFLLLKAPSVNSLKIVAGERCMQFRVIQNQIRCDKISLCIDLNENDYAIICVALARNPFKLHSFYYLSIYSLSLYY